MEFHGAGQFSDALEVGVILTCPQMSSDVKLGSSHVKKSDPKIKLHYYDKGHVTMVMQNLFLFCTLNVNGCVCGSNVFYLEMSLKHKIASN